MEWRFGPSRARFVSGGCWFIMLYSSSSMILEQHEQVLLSLFLKRSSSCSCTPAKPLLAPAITRSKPRLALAWPAKPRPAPLVLRPFARCQHRSSSLNAGATHVPVVGISAVYLHIRHQNMGRSTGPPFGIRPAAARRARLEL